MVSLCQNKLMEDLTQLNEAIINGDAKSSKSITKKALAAGRTRSKLSTTTWCRP